MSDQSLTGSVLLMLGSGFLGALASHAGAFFFRARKARRCRAALAAALADFETQRSGISELRLRGTIRLLTEPPSTPSTGGSLAQGPSSLANVRGLPLRAPDRDWKADTLPELAVVSC